MADTLKGTKHQLTGTGDVVLATSANGGYYYIECLVM